jgi:ABC-2 type transport system permease protein
MRGFWPIFKRELFSLFVTPLAWVLIAAFLLVQGIHFFLLVAQYSMETGLTDGGPVQAFFGKTILLYLPLLYTCPLLTMRLFAEERRGGTIEALLTTPVGTIGVTLGKYAAALVMYVVMWAPTLLYILLIARTGDVDWRTVLSGYAGVLAVGAGYLAIGTMTSTMTQSQVTAALVSTMIIVLLFMIGLGEYIVDSGPVHDACAYVSVWSQMNDFSQGIIDSRRLTFDTTLVIVPLFVAVRTVDSWRWG